MTEKREPRTVSVAVAAALLEMSPRAVRIDIDRGLIPAIRRYEGAHWRVLKSFCDAYREELERKSAKSAERAREYLNRQSA